MCNPAARNGARRMRRWWVPACSVSVHVSRNSARRTLHGFADHRDAGKQRALFLALESVANASLPSRWNRAAILSEALQGSPPATLVQLNLGQHKPAHQAHQAYRSCTDGKQCATLRREVLGGQHDWLLDEAYLLYTTALLLDCNLGRHRLPAR